MNHLLYFLGLIKDLFCFFRVEVFLPGGLGTVILSNLQGEKLGETKSWRVTPTLLTNNPLKNGWIWPNYTSPKFNIAPEKLPSQ